MDAFRGALKPAGVRIEHLAPLVAVLVLTLMFVHVEIERFVFPGDLEWMTGSVLDHIERVQHGLPLYSAPTADWVPFMYPPLYYWVVAQLARLIPIVAAARGLSLTCALITAACIFRLSRRGGASSIWSVLAAGLFFAAFGYTGFWYDLERVDMLCVALAMLAIVVLDGSSGAWGAVAAGALAGAAFFAKQPALLIAAGAATGLVIQRNYVRALAFGVAVSAVVAAGVIGVNAQTNGWFAYYVLQMPLQHGIRGSLVRVFITSDLPRAFTLTAATALVFATWLRRPREGAVFPCVLAAGFLAAGASRAHSGGFDNVLLFWVMVALPAVGIVATRLEDAMCQVAARACLGALVAAQCVAWAYRPDSVHPGRDDAGHQEAFVARVRADEAQFGEVLVTSRGHVSRTRHYHGGALYDVVRSEHEVPPAVVRAFADRRFGELILDSLYDLYFQGMDERNPLYTTVAASYYIADVIDHPPRVFVGTMSPPSLVLRRRTQVLIGASVDELNERLAVEHGIALMRANLRAAGISTGADDTVEEAARRILRQSRTDATTVPPATPATSAR